MKKKNKSKKWITKRKIIKMKINYEKNEKYEKKEKEIWKIKKKMKNEKWKN
jgi:hypothetical protein